MVVQGNRNNFVIDEEFVKESILRLPPARDLNTFPVELSTNQKVGDAILDHCVCLICKDVVWKAKQCGQCEKLVCKQCIESWLAFNPSCPACRQQFKGANVAKGINDYLEACQFKCQKAFCNRTFKYVDATAHLAEHEVPSFQCILNCGEQRIKGHNGMMVHLRNNCSKAQLKCSDCSIRKERDDPAKNNHNCDIELLKSANKIQLNEIEQLKTEILQLKQKQDTTEDTVNQLTRLLFKDIKCAKIDSDFVLKSILRDHLGTQFKCSRCYKKSYCLHCPKMCHQYCVECYHAM